MWAWEVVDGAPRRPAGYIGTYPSRRAAKEARLRCCRSGGYVRRVSWEPSIAVVQKLRCEASAAGDETTARDCSVVRQWLMYRKFRKMSVPLAALRRVCEVIADAAHAAGEALP